MLSKEHLGKWGGASQNLTFASEDTSDYDYLDNFSEDIAFFYEESHFMYGFMYIVPLAIDVILNSQGCMICDAYVDEQGERNLIDYIVSGEIPLEQGNEVGLLENSTSPLFMFDSVNRFCKLKPEEFIEIPIVKKTRVMEYTVGFETISATVIKFVHV